jgi:NitT/TauT family transport system substrate-binding protein
MYNAFRYIEETPVDKIADILIDQFPSTTKQSIIDSLNSYISIDAWQKDMIMTEQAFNRLQDIMENAGELDKRVSFNALVDNTIAEETYNNLFG